jgi:polysaccharide export outer membrane protein
MTSATILSEKPFSQNGTVLSVPSLRPLLVWKAATLACLLALSGLGWSQAMPTTPPDDASCMEQDCPDTPDQAGPVPDNAENPPGAWTNSGGGATQANGPGQNPAGPSPSWPIDPGSYNPWPNHPWPNHAPGDNGPGRNGDPDRARKRPVPFRQDALPEPPTQFQQFVASSVGRWLPIYGSNLFQRVPTTFAPVDHVPVTDDYRIGPGDEILLRVWGQIELNARLTVDREGNVFLPKVGVISIAGLKFEQLPEYFRTAMRRVFRDFDLTVSLGQLRSIQIFVVGQARRPGSYTVSSLCTLVNALFASGGPSSTGSLRRIQLKRNDTVVTEFDFYGLLLRGDKSKDVRLLSGDVIYIPPVGPSIALAGSVNVPAIYELRDQTSLGSAIEMAGGLATTADGQKAVVERIEDHNVRRVEEFPLDGLGLKQNASLVSGLGRPLQDGDVVRILALSPRFENAVTLRGNVARPGRVAWHSGMRLRELIPNQDALLTREYWRLANTNGNGQMQAEPRPDLRSNFRSDLRSDDRFDVPSDARFDARPDPLPEETSETRTDSSRRNPGTAAVELRNRITRDAPEINWDYAVIQRLNPDDLTIRLIPFNLGKLVVEGDEHNNLLLEPGDIITVFSQNDLAVPLEKRSKFVHLEGEFRAAGVYRAEPGETVRHLVERAGGLTGNAYLYGAEFTRESVRIGQQKGLDQMIESLEEDLTRNALAPGGLTPEAVADNREKLEAQRQLVDKLRAVRAAGRVVLDFKPDSSGVNDLPDIALEDGDRLVVPYRPSTVATLGAVYNKNSFLYQREARVEDYLRRAGGPTREADTSRMFVIRADGSILSKQSVKGLWNGNFASLRLMPGDAIVVPERLSHGSFLRGLRDWSQVFSQFALGAAAVRVIQ